MSTEDQEHDQLAAVSEQPIGDSQEDQQDEQKTVPLSAMLATRKKAQEADNRAQAAEAKAQMLEAYVNKLQGTMKQEAEEVEEPKKAAPKKAAVSAEPKLEDLVGEWDDA